VEGCNINWYCTHLCSLIVRPSLYSRFKSPISELIDRKLVRLYSYVGESSKAKKRDKIPEKTVLYWKIYDGGIVEAKSYGSK